MSSQVSAVSAGQRATKPAGRTGKPAASARRRTTNGLLYLALVAVAVFFVFPLLWVLSMSLKSVADLFKTPPEWIPLHPQWSNYTTVLEQTPLIRNTVNSLIIVGCTIVVAVALSLVSAYAVSRLKFRGRRVYERTILTAQMISPVVLLAALYPELVKLRLLNSYLSLVIVYVAVIMPFLTWFLRNYLDTVPRELDEAAMVDGCSRPVAFLRVIAPAARPGIASAAVLAAVMSWSEFVIPFIMLDNSNLFPISVGVLNLQSTGGSITLQYIAAGSVIAVLPVMIIFVIFQRQILDALTQGAVKG